MAEKDLAEKIADGFTKVVIGGGLITLGATSANEFLEKREAEQIIDNTSHSLRELRESRVEVSADDVKTYTLTEEDMQRLESNLEL